MQPWEQVRAILAEAKAEGMSWEAAWFRAMEALKPEKSCSPQLRQVLDEERDLTREVKPYWQAAYEGRAVTVAEFERVSAETEKRLDSILCRA